MAASSSDESTAPDNFQVSSASSNDDNDDVCDGLAVRTSRKKKTSSAKAAATLECHLCCTQQRQFYCRNCVKNGNIIHSKFPRSPNLFEKQQKYINIQQDLKIFRDRFEEIIKKSKEYENVSFEVKRKKEQIKLFQDLITRKKYELKTLKGKRDELRKANSDKQHTLPNYRTQVKGLSDYVLDHVEKTTKLRETRHILLNNLKQCTRRGILQLVEYIFPISEIVLKDEQRKYVEAVADTAPVEELKTIAALADAKNTSYIRGKWVFHGSSISEMQYRIVAPSLPANGDYTAYIDWLKENKDDVPKTTANDTPSRVMAFRIVGALTYTTQLTHLMSFFLNVPLPYKLAYGDFCKKLDEDQFHRKVSRLNSNIMYLAYTQQVKLRTLNKNHTLENILAILDLERSDLGRHGFQEVANAPLVKSVDSVLIGIETATESESEDENSIRLDWESVPNVPSTQQEINNLNLMTALGQQSTMGDGSMASVTKWISSYWLWKK